MIGKVLLESPFLDDVPRDSVVSLSSRTCWKSGLIGAHLSIARIWAGPSIGVLGYNLGGDVFDIGFRMQPRATWNAGIIYAHIVHKHDT